MATNAHQKLSPLFKAAEQGKLSFDDPAYGITRILLNGMLRQAEAFSLPHFAGMMLTRAWWSDAEVERRFNERYSLAQVQLTEAGRAAVRRAVDRAHVAIISHVLHISLIFGVPIHFVKVWYRLSAAMTTSHLQNPLESVVYARSARGPMHQTLGTLDASAHLVGDLDARSPMIHAT